jgi:hypothetical protein
MDGGLQLRMSFSMSLGALATGGRAATRGKSRPCRESFRSYRHPLTRSAFAAINRGDGRCILALR